MNRNNYETKKALSFHNIMNFLKARWNALTRSKHKEEQSVWRMEQIKLKSPECFLKGECFCGCDINLMVFQPDGCEEKNLCYPPLMNKKRWKIFKNNNYAN